MSEGPETRRTVVVVGVDHRRSPAEVVEALVSGSSGLYEAASDLLRGGRADEVVSLCTCLRSELYVSTSEPEFVLQQVKQALSDTATVGAEHTFAFEGVEAARHLFRIACGLQSTVLGEAEILGQIARTWETARAKGTTGPVLDGLFRHAIAAGKRARRDTLISHGVTSIAQAGVAMVKNQVQHLQGKRVLVIGAGDMGERMALAAARVDGIGALLIANRTWERASALADRVGGSVTEFSSINDVLPEVDVVFTSTGATQSVISVEAAKNAGRLVIVDFAVPRDTEAGVEDIEGIDLLLLEDLQAFAAAGADARAGEAAAVEQIVEDEVERFHLYENERSVVPAIARLRDHAESIRLEEFEKFKRKSHHLSDEQFDAIDVLTKSMINKLMHEPTLRLKQAANTDDPDQLIDVVRRLFGASESTT